MAGAVNPQLVLQMLKSRMAGASGVPVPGAPSGGGPPGAPGGGEESVAPAMREMQAAEPDYALKIITGLKKQIVDMIPSLSFKAPAASRALMSAFKGIDTAIKELQQAQATMNAVGGGLNMSAVPKQQPQGGTGTPDIVRAAT